MNIKCILELMKEKEHINLYAYGNTKMPMLYKIESLRGKKLGEKLFKVLEKYKDEILFTNVTTTYTIIEFAYKKDINSWLNNFNQIEEKRIPWENSHLDYDIESYISNKNYKLEKDFLDNVTIINLKVKKERKEKEKRKEQEALNLLEQVL